MSSNEQPAGFDFHMHNYRNSIDELVCAEGWLLIQLTELQRQKY